MSDISNLPVGTLLHNSFNGDTYPHVIVGVSIIRKRAHYTVKAIPFTIGDVRIYKGVAFSEETVKIEMDGLEIIRLMDLDPVLSANEGFVIRQSFNKKYLHPVGESRPTFRWDLGGYYSYNPHI